MDLLSPKLPNPGTKTQKHNLNTNLSYPQLENVSTTPPRHASSKPMKRPTTSFFSLTPIPKTRKVDVYSIPSTKF
jgi:hypothetical protein